VTQPFNILIGCFAGLLCSLGGALKDSPFEGFQPLKFFRSIGVGTAWGIVAAFFVAHPVLVFCCCGYAERLTVEGYKIIRAQRPGKFDLPDPSQLGRNWGFQKVIVSGGSPRRYGR
jgi:hypothetical protein